MKRGSAAILLAVVLVAAVGVIVLFSQPSTTGMQFRHETGYEPYSPPKQEKPSDGTDVVGMEQMIQGLQRQAATKPAAQEGPKPRPTKQQEKPRCPEKPSCTKSGGIIGVAKEIASPPAGVTGEYEIDQEISADNYPDLVKEACDSAFMWAQEQAMTCLLEELNKLKPCAYAIKGCKEVEGTRKPNCYYRKQYAQTYDFYGRFAPSGTRHVVKCSCTVDATCDP